MSPSREDGAGISRRTAIALVLVAAVLWSGGGVGVKLLDGTPALTIAGLRSLFAALPMLIALLARTRSSGENPLPLLRSPRVWGAATSYAVMVVSFVVAAKMTTAANAILLQYTAPIYVALLSWPLLKERVRPRDWLAVGGTVVGMAVFFLDDLSLSGKVGNLVAILSSFGFAGLPLLLRLEDRATLARGKRPGPHGPLLAITLGNAIAALVCLPGVLASPPASTKAWLVILLLGTCQIALPYLLYGMAIRVLDALESSLIASIEPILSPIWVVLATGEKPGRAALVGGAMIVAAVLLQTLGKAPSPSGAAAKVV